MTTAAIDTTRLDVLDGWRGVSILLVLAGHLFPLGPKRFELNGAVAAMGMAIFFTLSGFLITSFLLRRPEIVPFLIRRFCRIVPLAWAASALVLAIKGSSPEVWLAHLLFYANLPPFWLTDSTAHFWSLCLEVQFYVATAALVAVTGRRGLWALPLLCVAVTITRVVFHQPMTIVTWFRIDEILAGCTLALIAHQHAHARVATTLGRVPPALLLLGLLAACHAQAEPLNYLRPYFAAAAVGATLFNRDTLVAAAMRTKTLAYIAKVSYALYVFHPLLAQTWLGAGDVWSRYLKRPLLLAVLFAVAHLSTFKFEQRFIDLGHRLTSGRRERAVA